MQKDIYEFLKSQLAKKDEDIAKLEEKCVQIQKQKELIQRDLG